MFDPEWIRAQNQMEYPFVLADALAYKFGYRDADPATAVARYAAEAYRFSLIGSGVLETQACKLLVINGMEGLDLPDRRQHHHGDSGRQQGSRRAGRSQACR